MLRTAADLWREWERSGALRPGDYDSDIVDQIRKVMRRQGVPGAPIVDVLERAEWTPRDLLHALAPVVASFAGMQRDLLTLLVRIGGTTGTGENLRVVYEFAEDDLIDESLQELRETVTRLETVVVRMQPLDFNPSHAWDSPIRGFGSWGRESGFVGPRPELWAFASGVPDPVRTGHQRVDDLLARYRGVIEAVLRTLASVGDNSQEAAAWLRTAGDEADPALRSIVSAATADYWPIGAVAMVQGFAEQVAVGRVEPEPQLLDRLETWLDGFFAADAFDALQERTITELTDLLKLPTWGRRHELYSAWVATQVDRALDSKMEFVLHDGALRFPFRPTLVARFASANGDVEFWGEFRSPAEDLSGEGRKTAIQPDYRFLRRGSDVATTIAAVEVKQYLRAATKNPGAALRDYVLALPEAIVLLVAHGPLGRGVIDVVPPAERHRARIHRDVRVGRPRETAAFRRDIAALFPVPSPPKPSRPARIELRWAATVSDLDLHVGAASGAETSWRRLATPHSVLRKDVTTGGEPEIVDLAATASERLRVHVRIYSDDARSFAEAEPVVAFVWDDGERFELRPRMTLARSRDRSWDVAEIEVSGRVRPLSDSRRIVS